MRPSFSEIHNIFPRKKNKHTETWKTYNSKKSFKSGVGLLKGISWSMVQKFVILRVWSQLLVWSDGFNPEIGMIQILRIINSHDHVSMISVISMINDYFDFRQWSSMVDVFLVRDGIFLG